MDEQASFEARAVLAPRRARVARLALLLPVIGLVAIAWAGLSGPRSDKATTDITDPTAVAAPSLTVDAPYPAQVIGLDVQRLDDVQPRGLGRDDVIAVAGWYVATAITDCPPLAAIYREGSLPEVRGDADELAFCVRSGVLFASRPDAGVPSVTVTVVVGVVVPPKLEMIGTDATEVVVVGRFVESGDGCGAPAGCRRELLVDHVAWTPDV
jgi:hypothetical protein